MSRSPATASVVPAALRPYEASWEAIYNLIDEGAGWSGHERNCFFLNSQGPAFVNLSAATGLDFDDDGRALALTDWDMDGRLDCWVVNRTAPRMRLLRNASPSLHHHVAFRLRGTQSNRDGIGARVEVWPSGEPPIIRTLRAGEGYLSQSSKLVHFGLGNTTKLEKVVVRWPGGGTEVFAGVAADSTWVLAEGTGKAAAWKAPRGPVALAAGPLEVPDQSGASRTWLAGRVLFPGERHAGWDGAELPLPSPGKGPLLINLWSRHCGPCLEELGEWNREAEALKQAGLGVLALCVDGDPEDRKAAAVEASTLPFASGLATDEITLAFETTSRAFLESRRPLPVPTSLLLDRNGLVAALYKGKLTSATLLADVARLTATAAEQRDAALPFPGRWNSAPLVANPRLIIGTLMKASRTEAAKDYTVRCLDQDSPMLLSPSTRASLTLFLGDLDLDRGAHDTAVSIYARLFDIARDDAAIHREVAIRLVTKQKIPEALRHLEHAVSLDPSHLDSRLNLASLLVRTGQSRAALPHFLVLAQQRPDLAPIRLQVAQILHAEGRMNEAIEHYQAAHRLHPGSRATAALAWLRATHRGSALRDGREALRLAQQLTREPGGADAESHVILAAAYAEAGQFEQATTAAERARELAQAASDSARVARVERYLALLRDRQAIRE